MATQTEQNVETETVRSDTWHTTIRARGELADVANFTEDYMRRFHPSAYGTHVTTREELPDGRYQFTITRGNTSD